ncbi:hypothetical protein IW261DRAFT_1418034 [Armillaria novae-zelandiae]|uniref:Uncharacterized protein n=1 Tax=Armillaria novae-zelandiae TaxID=153914 RepID=A0AA39TDX0_9AGAR|nr:hypothetical protein IW261DRAFT_1418034 [Armillaria novae-zelandiae]
MSLFKYLPQLLTDFSADEGQLTHRPAPPTSPVETYATTDVEMSDSEYHLDEDMIAEMMTHLSLNDTDTDDTDLDDKMDMISQLPIAEIYTRQLRLALVGSIKVKITQQSN